MDQAHTTTVLTDVGQVEVLSLSAKELTHGEICAHLAEVYGAQVSNQTISTITDVASTIVRDWAATTPMF